VQQTENRIENKQRTDNREYRDKKVKRRAYRDKREEMINNNREGSEHRSGEQ
jgi:hypothetical protein